MAFDPRVDGGHWSHPLQIEIMQTVQKLVPMNRIKLDANVNGGVEVRLACRVSLDALFE